MTYYVSSVMLNSTHSLVKLLFYYCLLIFNFIVKRRDNIAICFTYRY